MEGFDPKNCTTSEAFHHPKILVLAWALQAMNLLKEKYFSQSTLGGELTTRYIPRVGNLNFEKAKSPTIAR